MGIKRAADVLNQRTDGASRYVKAYGHQALPPRGAVKTMDPAEHLREAIYNGDRGGVITALDQLLARGEKAQDLVDTIMIPAIVEVGNRYERRELFLPQLIAAAEAMEGGLARLEPLLREKGAQGTDKGRVVLATVKGDIHDIGKNIVALMLRNHGFAVTDLGKDVPTEGIVAAVKELRPHVVGLSALMTTTMTVMEEVIGAVRREGLSTPFILGGAVVTEAYARSLGAAYGKDGVDAVRVVENLVRKGERKRR
ncbi:MAG: corrinoid protein [Syntrophales bacterium]|nr:corrinoid protein [Syntrophales bacterium]